MAPKKKSKKPAANPARGFATTSVQSKAKVEAEAQEAQEPKSPGLAPGSPEPQPTANGNPTAQNGVEASDLAKLTPEELEARLLEGELQFLVEKNGPKVKKEVSRIVSKLLTERRLFRDKVEILHVSKWMPSETMRNLEDQLQSATLNEKPGIEQTELLGHDELSIKLWALRLCLNELGLAKEVVLDVLVHIAQQPSLIEKARTEESRDGLWGLGVALEWLGIFRQEDDLPAFDLNVTKSKPAKELAVYQEPQSVNPINSSSISSTSAPTTPDLQATAEPTLLPLESLDINQRDLDSSDDEDDDDLNPREQMERYVELKTKIFHLQPELSDTQGPATKKSKNGAPVVVVAPRCSQLLKRIKALESDILFDRDAARDAWMQKKVALLKETTERKRLGLENRPPTQLPVQEMSTLSPRSSLDLDSLDNVGDFFSGLPQENNDTGGAASMTTSTTDGKTITIRDFGKWTGVNPRRVLEETCKSRDSGIKITYEIISQSPFSVRQCVKIHWSRSQEIVSDETTLPGLICEDYQRMTLVRMDSSSAPDKMQSEAFVSVAALFHVFAASSKEEKAYLKLPSIWRELWSEFAALRNERLDAADRADLKEVRNVLEQHYKIEEEKKDDQPKSSLNPLAADFAMKDIPTRPRMQRSTPEAIAGLWHAKSASPYYQHMLQFRQQLPMWNFRDQLLESMQHNQIIIVCGETGCGKSTQTPAYILEHELSQGRDCKIYCTEPRRISAISLARRVSEELGERKHDVGTNRSLVGYAIRLETQISATTKLVYATTGIVMRMLENPDGLDDVTHIILDEVHERTIDSDFLLIILRRIIARRPDLRIVLMSATVNADLFSKYLGGAPVLNVPGRTFPVEVKYLEDAVEAVGQICNLNTISSHGGDDYEVDDHDNDEANNASATGELADYSPATRKFLSQFNEFRINFNLIVKLLEAISAQPEYEPYSKAILVFLPGLAEIRKVNDMLSGHHMFSRFARICILHSTISSEAQEAAFEIPPAGIRKIVLSTNIAETGVTIPDVTCVIDTGKHREMRFDEKRQLSRLVECYISKANAKQRRGRAGRVQNGLCFHLFSSWRHDNVLADQQTPEMLRLSLQDLSLRVKILGLGTGPGGIEEVLLQALDAPLPKNIRRAVDSLVDVKAITPLEELTPLGRQLAKLPLDVYLGKLILFSSIFQCLDAGLTIAAILSSKSPFLASFENRNKADQARLSFRKGDSDLLTIYNAYCSWRKSCQNNPQGEYTFCRKYFLDPHTLSNIEDLKGQLAGIMEEAKFFKLEQGQSLLTRVAGGPYAKKFVNIPDVANRNASNELIVNAVITWSFYPKVLSKEGKGYRSITTNQTVSMHPGSINKGNPNPPRYLSYYSIMQSSSKFYNALETSAAEDLAIALICGDAEFKTYSGIMTIDGNRLRFGMSNWKTMVVLKAMRMELKDLILQNLRHPGREMSAKQQLWFDTLRDLFDRQKEIRKQLVR